MVITLLVVLLLDFLVVVAMMLGELRNSGKRGVNVKDYFSAFW
jgi:hypothetical protein